MKTDYVVNDYSHTDKKVYIVNAIIHDECTMTQFRSVHSSLEGAEKSINEDNRHDFLEDDDYFEIVITDLKD